MKKLLSIIIFISILTSLTAQNVWRPINMMVQTSEYLGVCTDETIFAYDGYNGSIIRSQDEGATWETVLDHNIGLFNTYRFTINKNNRIFTIEGFSKIVYYSDDKGDNWQQTTPVPIDIVYVRNLYSPSNDVLLGWTSNEIFWTVDAGNTWNVTTLNLNSETSYISCIIANEDGEVYASVWGTYPYDGCGIYHATLSDMQNWTLTAFEGWPVYSMAFDPEGYIVASYYGTHAGTASFLSQNGFYLIKTRELAVADNGITYKLGYGSTFDTMRLNYSSNHGANFFSIGEYLPVGEVPAPGPADGYLFKGNDNHLYFLGNGQYYKSVRNADEIVPGVGTLAKIDAPYFENNANNYRFAIINEIDTCYTMVNGLWPNPYSDELIVKYDTIALGIEMDVTGIYSFMEDDNGNTFQVVDIQNYNNAIYSYSTGYLISWGIDEIPQITDVYTNPKYYVAINGELQTDYPVTFNGLTLNAFDGIYTFVGIAETWPDYDLPVLNLYDIITYSTNLNINGIIIPDDLCMILPCDDDKYLSCNDGTQEYYLTSGEKPIGKNWYSPLWGDNTNSTIAGIRGSIFDLYGNEIQTIEIRQLESDGERTLNGQLRLVGAPPGGGMPPIGMDIVIHSDAYNYFIDNERYDEAEYCIIENDTLPYNRDITAIISSSYMFIDGQNVKRFRVHIDDIWVNDTTSVTETNKNDFSIYPNPSNGIIFVLSDNINSEYLITNILGETVMSGKIASENQQINVSSLTEGIYFIKIGDAIMKFLKK